MGTTWGRYDIGGPHVGPMNLAIWEVPEEYEHNDQTETPTTHNKVL